MVKIFLCILILIIAQFAGSFISDKLEERSMGKMVRITGSGAAFALFVIFFVTSLLYTTTDQEIGFVNQLGINTPFEESGLKVKTPFVSMVIKYPGTTQSMTLGYIEASEDSNDYETNNSESSMITSDFNFIEVDAYLEYQIIDPIEYHYATADPIGILRNAALTAIKNNVGLNTVDDVYTTGRAQVEAQITESIIAELETHKTGLALVKISIQDVDLPTQEVKDAFEAVEKARQEAEEQKNNANGYAFKEIPNAEAEATQIIAAADAARTERINEALAEVSKFEALWTEYKNSNVVKDKLYYDVLVMILPEMDIIISPDGNTVFVKGTTADISAVGAASVTQ